MPVSKLDKFYKSMIYHKFFIKGWGDPHCYDQLYKFRKLVQNRDNAYKLVSESYPVTILHEQTWADYQIFDGYFKTPLVTYLPDTVPAAVENAYFQLIIPKKWGSASFRPICIHLAATGDHYFWRRRNIMVKPLLKAGLGSIILENPFYGLRKPKNQFRSCLHYVSDIFIMGGCLILECLVLLHWCERMKFGPLGLTGVSMGGHMASLGATAWPKPLVLVPCLSWSTGSSVFTEGVLSNAIDWDLLQKQFYSEPKFCEYLSKQCKIVDDPFLKPNSIHISVDKNSRDSHTPHEILSLLNDRKSETTVVLRSKLRKRLSAHWPSHAHRTLNLLFSFITEESLNMKQRNQDAVWFMIGLMDEFTHLKNYSVPFDTSLVTAFCAKSDGYVPRTGCSRLEDLWPGATVRYLDTGHVGATIWHNKSFRKAIIEAFEKAKQKYCLRSEKAA